MTQIALVAVVVAVFLASWFSIGAAPPLLRRLGAVDVPNERSSHRTPRPRGAGVFVAAIATTGLVLVWVATGAEAVLWFALAGGAVLSAVGLIDDVQGLSVRARLSFQGVCAVVAAYVAVAPDWRLPLAAAVAIGGVALFVVATTNIFNFMDGIDGIAGSTAMAAGVTFMVLGLGQGRTDLAGLGAVVAASAAGFLVHNWSPASVFMGDAGSLYLGFLLASSAFGVESYWDVAVLIAPLLPFLIDGVLTILRRAVHRENLTSAHRDHLYQIAAIRFGHGKIAGLYAMASVIAGLGAVAAPEGTFRVATVGGFVLLGVAAWFIGNRRIGPVG